MTDESKPWKEAGEKARNAAANELVEMLIKFPAMGEAGKQEWIKQAYLSEANSVAYLRAMVNDLRKYALQRVREMRKTLSVSEARLLNCCRVCLGEHYAPFTYNYGEEHAHTKCL